MNGLTRNLTIFISGFILSVMLVFFAIKPVLSDVSRLHDSIQQQKTESVTLDRQIRAFKTAQSDLSKASRKSEISTAIPAKETLVDAVKDLESAAAKTGVDHTLQIRESTDPGLVKAPPVVSNRNGISEVSYKLNAVSDFAGIVRFLDYLEHLPHFTEISKINLSAETTEAANNKVNHTGRILGNFDGVFFIKASQ